MIAAPFGFSLWLWDNAVCTGTDRAHQSSVKNPQAVDLESKSGGLK